MARPYRLQGEGIFYHITSRGNRKKRIFNDINDYNKFLEYTKQAKEKYNFYLYAYCLMSNHYHFLLETTRANLSQIMHYLNGSYTMYYNIKRQGHGHVFQGRYKSIVVDKDSYFQELSRYIHLNPVRAKIAKAPEEYKWSSYSGYLGKSDDVIDKEQIKQYLTINKTQYREFVLEGIGKQKNPFSDIHAGFLLGKVDFIKEKLKDLQEKVKSREFSYRKEIQSLASTEEILKAVAEAYKCKVEDIKGSKNRAFTAKKIAIYLLKRYTSLTNPEIGEIFELTFSAISKAAKEGKMFIQRDREVKKIVKKIISSFKG